ncbi:hypothetical protein PIB30_043359 [Stylosanthes scabra]|uniref:PB1-like domain-containing protein n=1 Tax=Stylosanthes scabra TaxID=79078 RepID=A0ABU6WF80_9FABA|nr:hypothetical protein [Stylosanthes scabra]
MSSYITVVYHHMGKMARDSNMNLVYEGGEKTFFDFVNPEKFSWVQMKDLFKGLGYREYNYMYWLDEDLGFNGDGLNMITGDLAVLRMCEWAVSHDNSVNVYFDHKVDKAVEFVDLVEEDDDHVNTQLQTNHASTQVTPKKKRIKMRANRTGSPMRKPINRKAKNLGQAFEDLLDKLAELEHY